MSKKQQAALTLAVALIGGVVAHKVAGKQAAALGIPVFAVTVAGALLGAAL